MEREIQKTFQNLFLYFVSDLNSGLLLREFSDNALRFQLQIIKHNSVLFLLF